MTGDLASRLVREPSVQDAAHYRRRSRRLAAVFAWTLVLSLTGLWLLLRQAKLYVTLAQRTNVETLTLALGCAMFLILTAMCLPGGWGALAALRAEVAGMRGGEGGRERAKASYCERRGRRAEPVIVVLNAAVEGGPGRRLSFALADAAGDLGELIIDGAVVRHERAFRSGSNSLLAYFVEQVRAAVGRRGERPWLEIVAWGLLDGEDAARFASIFAFARAVEARLGSPLWPRVELTEDDVREIGRRLTEAVPSARLEAMLPDWEYRGEHKLPVVPEPLGFLTLTRSENRVDPLASMSMMLVILALCVLALAALAYFPVWTPAP
jgi:hypothetical protein